jgi:hypothetical protein
MVMAPQQRGERAVKRAKERAAKCNIEESSKEESSEEEQWLRAVTAQQSRAVGATSNSKECHRQYTITITAPELVA